MERVKHRSGVWVALYIFYSLFISTPLLTWKKQEALSEVESSHLRYTLIRSSLNSAGVSSWKGVYHHVMSKHSVTSRQNRYVWRGRSPSVYLALVTLMLSGDIETCPGPTELRLFYQNTHSIKSVDRRSKFNQYFENHNQYDIICITETWLNPGIKDGDLLSKDYYVFRRDRQTTTEGIEKKRGGGVMTAIRKDYPACSRKDLETDMEIVWCEVMFDEYSVYVGTVYIPPDTNTDVWDKLTKLNESLELLYEKINPDRDEIILMGDFNRGDICWQETMTGCRPFGWTSGKSNKCVGLLVMNLLTQHNALATREDHVLDLVCTSDLDCELSYTESAVKSDHQALLGIARVKSPNECCRNRLRKLNPYMVNCNTLKHLACDFYRISENLAVFHEIREATRVMRASAKSRMQRSNYPDWFNRNELTAGEKMRVFQHHARCFPYILLTPESNIPKVMLRDDLTEIKDSRIPEEFNHFFGSAFTDRRSCNNQPLQMTDSYPITDINIDQYQVQRLLISNQFVEIMSEKESYKDLLAGPLCKIFNVFLSHGTYPDSLKEELVVPVFDEGVRNIITNYRPIRLPNAVRDVYERAVIDTIFHQIGNCLSLDWRGFVEDIDTHAVRNLVVYTDMLLSAAFCKHYQTDAIFLKIPNAFDRVSHKSLMDILHSKYGFTGPLLEWLRSYLTERKQAVLLNGKKSERQPILSGVPRESHLGRMLFALLVNEAVESLRKLYPGTHVSMYGEVIMLSRTIDSVGAWDELQGCLNEVHEWCTFCQLELDVPKCKTISFTKEDKPTDHTYKLDERPLRKTVKIQVHGVTFSSNMEFGDHIDLLVEKAHKMVDFVIRYSSAFQDKRYVQNLYKSLVPKLEFASREWRPNTQGQINRIENVQKKFVKFWCHLVGTEYSEDSYEDLCNTFNLLTLELRCKQPSK